MKRPDHLGAEADQLAGARMMRRAVFDLALRDDEPFSSADLVARCRELTPPVSRATVYRNLKMLLDRGLLAIVTLKERERLYQKTGGKPRLAWICDHCASITILEADGIVEQLGRLAKQNGLPPGNITVRVHARCPDKNCEKTG